jgi:hypothetical protein
MTKLEETLKLQRCPHCSVDTPNLTTLFSEFTTSSDNGDNQRLWRVYICKRCGGVVTAFCYPSDRDIYGIFPTIEILSEMIPDKARTFLQQAIDSVFAPAGCVLLCASSVDAMLKEKGLVEGNLNSRINKAAKDGLITNEMATWAHQVRLDANDQRHSDNNADFPTIEEAKKSIEFTKTLAEFIFVLPSKVTKGIETSRNNIEK